MRSRRRTEIELALRANSAFHVGRGGEDLGPDQVLATDTAGRFHVPGTSFAGALRARLRAAAPERVDEVFGFSGKDDAGQASSVVVSDAPVELPDGSSPQVLSGVALDRRSGTAADRFLYDRVVLPKGTTFSVLLSIDDQHLDPTTSHGANATTILRLLAGIRDSEGSSGSVLRLGAGTTRGLGELTVDPSRSTIRTMDLDGPGLLDALYDPPARSPLSEVLPGIGSALEPVDSISIDVAFRARGPLMIRGDHPSAIDAVPRFAPVDGMWSPVIPGTSVKGVLRQAAERIVATVLGLDVPDPIAADDPRVLLDQHDLPLVRMLFGSVKTSSADGSGSGRRGILQVTDLIASSKEHRLTPQGLRELLAGSATEQAGFQRAVHVALDRFTGGAAEHLLYDVLEPHGVAWPPIHLEVQLPSWDDDDAVAALGMLFLVLQELEAGLHGLGAFAERGHGDIQVERIEVVSTSAPRIDEAATSSAPSIPERWHLDEPVWQAAAAAWQRFLEREEVA